MQDENTRPDPTTETSENNQSNTAYSPNLTPPQTTSMSSASTLAPQQRFGNLIASDIVWQWLTYAFWGWTLLAMSTLIYFTIEYYMNSNSGLGSFSAYAIATVLVLLPASLVTDFIYSKKEVSKKQGASSAVMIIHAVIFALFGIGAIITAVYAIVSMITYAGSSEGNKVTLVTALIVATLYILTFIRTLIPEKIFKLRRFYSIIMGIIVAIVLGMYIAGPVSRASSARNDTLITNNLTTIDDAIKEYLSKNNRLPDSLDALNLSGDAKKLVTEKLVTYKNEGKVTEKSAYGFKTEYFRFQLCVVFKEESKDKYGLDDNSSEYASYLSLSPYSSHPAGEYCYKRQEMDSLF